MDNIFDSFLKDERFDHIYTEFKRAIELYDMADKICQGVLVGLSGGADSVMLLLLMKKYSLEVGGFKILACHVNHGIRGDEADRDEAFSLALANRMNIEAISLKFDCLEMRSKTGGSLEEVARNARYRGFSDIIQGRNDISYIAIAHNADDNIETVLFNLMRGTGIAGLCGIPPVRDNILRPMIFIKKSEIVNTLTSADISYVTDSTNLDEDYSRNYIRSKIVPAMLALSPDLHSLVSRASYNLRIDNSFIDDVARSFLKDHADVVCSEDLRSLHHAVISRVIMIMAKEQGCFAIEQAHISKIISLLDKNKFSYSLPQGYTFICEFGKCRIEKTKDNADFFVKIEENYTEIADFSAAVVISDRKTDKISSNVYNFSIHADISSVIINNGIFVRNRQDGDSYRYGGITHKLKKLFNDSKIPPSIRDRIPVFCDDSGIIWVPGFGVRDDGYTSTEKKYISLLLNSTDGKESFFIPRTKNPVQ